MSVHTCDDACALVRWRQDGRRRALPHHPRLGHVSSTPVDIATFIAMVMDLGAKIHGAEMCYLGAKIHGAEMCYLGAMIHGAEVSVFVRFFRKKVKKKQKKSVLLLVLACCC
jgi:hypothetical protein